MKKKIVGGIIQYGVALLAVLLTVLYIVAYNSGVLPFSEDGTVVRPEVDVSVDVPDVRPEVSEEVRPITATEFIASLPVAAESDVINIGFYDGSQVLVRRSASPMGDLGGAGLVPVMGFVYKYDADGNIFVYDSYLRDVTEALSGQEHTLCRDGEGRVLFFGNGAYSYVQDGALVGASYDPLNFDKGVEKYKYPSYLAGANKEYSVFGTEKGYGLRRNSDGETVLKAVYADVYSPSEGYIVAVDDEDKMYLYKTDGTLVTDAYRVPAENEDMIGYFFVRNGLVRACKENGEEVLVNTDGVALGLPSDYDIVAYSDGIALLKGVDGNYGYFSSKGGWLGNPYYEDAEPFYEGLAVVCSDGLYGMIDTDGNLVVPCVFDTLSDCQDGVIIGFTQKNGYCVLNKINGNVE